MTVVIIFWHEMVIGESASWAKQRIEWIHGRAGLVTEKLQPIVKLAQSNWALYPQDWTFALHPWFLLAEPPQRSRLILNHRPQ